MYQQENGAAAPDDRKEGTATTVEEDNKPQEEQAEKPAEEQAEKPSEAGTEPQAEVKPAKGKGKAKAEKPAKAAKPAKEPKAKAPAKPKAEKAAKPAAKAKTPAKPAKGKAEAKKPNGKGKAKAEKPAKAAKPKAELDVFGFRKGSLKSQAAAMYSSNKGATLLEVKLKLNSSQLNLLKELEGQGYPVDKKKEPGKGKKPITRYFLHTTKKRTAAKAA